MSEWKTKVQVRGLTGKQRAKLLQTTIDHSGRIDLERIYPELLIYTVYDPKTGEPVFTPEDRDALLDKSGAALERLAQVALRLSGLNPGAVEVAAKN